MYKVFLVDDEIVVREGIRSGFPWEQTEFTLCGEASDGEIALPMMQDLKPDILITDIQMPFMDGLELSRQVARDMPWVHIVILSGYDDFAYAQEAISLGVKEYMLKPVTAQSLGGVLENIAKKIGEERARQADMEALRAQLETSARYGREKALAALLEEGASPALLEEAARLGIEVNAREYLVMLLDDPGDRLALRGAAQRLAEGADGSMHPALLPDALALLLIGDGRADIEERAYALARALEHEAATNPVVAIGEPVSHVDSLPRALISARAVRRAMEGQSRRIVGFADVDIPLPTGWIEGEILPLREKLRYAAQEDGPRLVEEYFASLGDTAVQSVILMHYMLVDVLLAASHIIRQCGGDAAEVLPARLMQQGELLLLSEKPGAALAAGQELVACALSFRDRNAFSRYGEILRKARAYIEENHQRPEITLRDVAGHVALSNNHFCTIFSQEMGITFTEYLTDVRIAKAKALLSTTAMRSSDIAYAVGYNDPRYFGYLFKKNTGMSPRDYRKSVNP